MIKDNLRKARKLYLEIEAKKRQREKLYLMVMGSNIQIKEINVQTSLGGDKLGDTIAEVADLDQSIRERIDELIHIQREAVEIINRLDKPEHRAIMIDYYLNAYTWEQVADLSGYSVQHTLKMHGDALKELQDKSK